MLCKVSDFETDSHKLVYDINKLKEILKSNIACCTTQLVLATLTVMLVEVLDEHPNAQEYWNSIKDIVDKDFVRQ